MIDIISAEIHRAQIQSRLAISQTIILVLAFKSNKERSARN
jgi:hypothetical protein